MSILLIAVLMVAVAELAIAIIVGAITSILTEDTMPVIRINPLDPVRPGELSICAVLLRSASAWTRPFTREDGVTYRVEQMPRLHDVLVVFREGKLYSAYRVVVLTDDDFVIAIHSDSDDEAVGID